MAESPDLKHGVQTTVENKIEKDDKYKSESTEKVTFGHFFRIFSYATPLELAWLAIASVASIGAGVTMPLMNIIFGNLVNAFNGFFSADPPSPDEFMGSINKLTLYLVYLWIGKFVLCYVSMLLFRAVSIRVSSAIRLAYLQALFAQPIGVLDKMPPGSAANTITGQANLLQIGISEKISTCLQSLALLVAAYVIAFTYSWQLTLAASSILVFVLLVYSAVVPIMIKLQKSKDHADEKATSIASETFSSIRMVAACGAEKRVAAAYSGWVEESRRRGLKMGPVLGAQFSPFFFALYADFALVFWFGVKLFNDGVVQNVATVLIVLMSVLMSIMSLGAIVAPVVAATKAAGAATTFFAMIDSPTQRRGGLKSPDVTATADIQFKDVVFAYPSRPHVKVLDSMSVTFETGKLTAIVGPSGSGKSTVVGLLERWYELSAEVEPAPVVIVGDESQKDDSPEIGTDEEPVVVSGSIMIDGKDITTLDIKWWRSQIGLVQQEPFIFNDTIFNNVAHGLIGSKFENEDDDVKKRLVIEACQEAYADEFINRLPQGYETAVGDSGIKLSGGQRQRLAIARSIVKRPQILIFDEATSAIDVRSERIVQGALDRVAKGRTTITIAHRLSTIKKADKIVVCSKGTVVEQGSHDELITREGVYHGLVFAQQLSIDDSDDELLDEIANEAGDLHLLKSVSKPCSDGKPGDVEKGVAALKTGYKPKGTISSFGLLLIEQKRHLPWLFITLFAASGPGAGQPVQAYLMGQIITIFQYLRGDPRLTSGATYWSLRFVYLAIGVGVGYFIIGWASTSFSTHVSCTYRQEYFESITSKPIGFFDEEDHSTGTLVSRVSSDPTQLQEMMGTNMAMALIAIFSIIGCIAIAFVFGWKLTLVALFSGLPIIIAASFYRVRFEIQFEQMNAAVFAESSKFAAEAIGAFRTVTSLTLEDMICERYSRLLQGHVDAAGKKARWTTLVFALSDSVGLPCMALTFWYGGRLMSTREYDPLSFLVIYTAIIQGSEAAGSWMSFGPNMAQATAAANRILSFRTTETTNNGRLAIPDKTGGANLGFSDVHFTYPTRESPIFRGLNLSIEAGQFAALVGPSGCGKTSIVSLLEQFYQIQRGSITFDGIDIKDLDLAEYRKQFSLVAQEPTLFQGTIKENILLGVEEGTVSDEQLFAACKDAEIHAFITSLPDGYSTDVGSRGVALSGGQKQRLAIARALVRQPRVLLLDEATSSLDSESEKLVQAAFERAAVGRTMVVVAHRLATVQNADIIFVLGNSEGNNRGGARVLERGTHKELVSKRGVYYQMCQSQALDR